jgi:hypothetical protein
MNRHLEPDFDQRIADWLEADPNIAPREVLGTVLAAYRSIPQRRALRPPWRLPAMRPVARFATAAAIAVVLVGTAIVVTRPAPSVGTSPSASAAASPTVDPNRVQALQLSGAEALDNQTYLFDGDYEVVYFLEDKTQDRQCDVTVVARVGTDVTHDVFLLAYSLAPGSTARSTNPEPISFPHGLYHIVVDSKSYPGLSPGQQTVPPKSITTCTSWSLSLTAR